MSSSKHSSELRRLALSVLQPGFVGTEAPDWVLRAVADGLSSVVLFTRNIVTPEQVARLTERLRAENPALIVAIDEEAGDVTRIESATGSSRPGNFALGTVDDPALTEAVAADLGRELRAAGVSLDYAPSADVNSNPDNPVIGVRSFGTGTDVVSRHTAAWVRGLQSAGVAACAKHFPGHGDVAVDSHHDLPAYRAGREEIEARALPPFRAAVEAGARAVMSAHLLVPAYDAGLPATLSRRVLHGLLREELGFDGLVVSDAIEMAAVTRAYGIGGAAVRAVAAGVDAVCVGGESAEESVTELLADALAGAVAGGELPAERLADAARRVGEFAEWSVKLRESAAVPAGSAAGIGAVAARRAVRVTGDAGALPLGSAPHVVELAPVTHLAIAKETPWGVAAPLRERLPGTTSVRVHAPEPADGAAGWEERALRPAAGRPLVVVVRDAARHAWMSRAVAELTRARPDAVLVEMGLPHPLTAGAAQVFTHGASTASGVAAAEVLTGGV
ncbi:MULTISPECIES: glycoside hydrolase family 3 protein [Streptomyces]|uniref:Beta-N-acetylhexosaminidase n=2 Tax=Streptomyces TaxID=1883 RepID=A0ABT9LRB2_STRGD|nr:MULTISPECIES: glycoside hydrolase family 3 N-terminal domain-containing protein [Streptomyces]MDP9686058.1 beta-N-acetylhexosaminidase [Streptomyces griseoviridis]GGS79086.1 hydrolase [Streptomyces griseoviridis]GGU16497.1 hydrolase [Streptomyces daghestanicus]GHI35345.1 hydrolase [Streptomyces daghestanicus]